MCLALNLGLSGAGRRNESDLVSNLAVTREIGSHYRNEDLTVILYILDFALGDLFVCLLVCE